MRKKTWRPYLFEGILIIFSVLLALFLNQLVENRKVRNLKNKARENIQTELQRNLEIINDWGKHHQAVSDRVQEIIDGKNDSLRNALKSDQGFNIGVLTGNKSIIDANLSNTAWETAKSTQIISEFDFETAQLLTSTYTLQDILINTSLDRVVTTYFDRETHDLSNLDLTLIQFKLAFQELAGQEYLLAELYEEAINKLE